MIAARTSWILAFLSSLGALIGPFCWNYLGGAEPNKPPSKQKPNQLDEGVRTFMRSKLAHSQKLLEAIVLDDFAVIKQEGTKLGALNQAVEWQVLRTEEYLAHSADFRRASDSLVAAANEENSEGAALAYMEMTMRCVRCHHYIRDIRMAGIRPASTVPIAQRIDPMR